MSTKCIACGAEIGTPTVNPPPDAGCYRDHSVIDGCACEPAISKARGNWVLDVFKPLPPDEAKRLREYL